MAIYKPSNCLPFLSCLDLTKPQNISCELNTSNETVTGYKIKILDSNNDVIFEGAEFSSINPEGYNNSGTNGSTLTLPLIVEGEKEPKNPNIIYYANGKFVTNEKSFFKSDKFSNDYANQPYKWEITLSQTGDSNTPNKPKSDEYYDMVLDQGKILGSNRNRLQSALSENIKKDYFIQLNNRTLRVPIKSYDYSFGYVYPKENVLTDEEVNNASYFEIYKFSNDPEVVSAASQVLIRTTLSMNEVSIDGQKNTVSWGENLVYPNYFTQKFEGMSGPRNDLPISAYDTSWNSDNELTDDNNKLSIGSVIMVAAEGNGSSAYNGIFNLQSIDNEKGSDGKTIVTVKWLRNAASDTWATLTNKVYYVQHGSTKGKRYQVNTEKITGVGVINSSIVKFEEEKPVGLYTTPQYRDNIKDDNKTKAPIFKNDATKAYIRPYSGPQKNIKLAYIKPNETKFTYIDGNVFSDGWYFEPERANLFDISKQTGFINSRGMILGSYYYSINDEDKTVRIRMGVYGDSFVFSNPITLSPGDYVISAKIQMSGKDGGGNDASLGYRLGGYDGKTYSKYYEIDVEKDFTLISYPFSLSKKSDILILCQPNGTANNYENVDFIAKDIMLQRGLTVEKPGSIEVFTPDEVSYKLLTFYNSSDENPFYAKISPTITIESEEIQEDNSLSGLTNYKCVGRVLNVKGKITGRKWVNFKWVLTDLNMGYIQYTDVTYAGDIQATFYGLQNNHIYELSLTIEDEFGDVWVEQKLFEVMLNMVESEFPFTATYECETQSVLLDFSEKGIIIPTPSILQYENYLVKIRQNGGTEDANYQLYLIKESEDSVKASVEFCVLKDSGESTTGYTISYDSSGLTLSDVSVELQEDLIPDQLIEYKNQRAVLMNVLGEIAPPPSDDITLNSQHILNSNFTGTVVSYKIDTKDVNTLESYLELNIVALPVRNYSQKDGGYVANDDRNVLFLQVIKNVNKKEVWNSNKEISLYELVDGNWKNVEAKKNRWQENNQIAFSLVAPDPTTNKPIINKGVDYIETTNSYEYKNGSRSVTTNQNIFESYNSSEGLMGSPLIDAAEKQGTNYNVWSTKGLEFIQQTSYGDKINVKTNVFNEWEVKNKENDKYYYWHIYGNGGAPTHFVKANHSGRQNINKYKFTFNIVIKDYNTKAINNAFILNNIKAKVFKETV